MKPGKPSTIATAEDSLTRLRLREKMGGSVLWQPMSEWEPEATEADSFHALDLPKGHTGPETVSLSDDGDGKLLGTMMRGVARELRAAEILVVWHSRTEKPIRLFHEGECQPQAAAEHAMIESAILACRASSGSAASIFSDTCPDVPGTLLTAAIPLPDGTFTITSRFRALDASALDPSPLPSRRDAFARLLPLLRPFLCLWSARQSLIKRVCGLTAAVEYSDVATFLVNRSGEILFVNKAGEQLLARKIGISRRGAMLGGLSLSETLRLQAAIEHICAKADGDAGIRPVIALRCGRRRPLIVTLVAANPTAGNLQHGAAVIYAFDPEQDLTSFIEPACQLYGLSLSETRLCCQLAKGKMLTEAAKAIGIREQTARTYLKQIFLKTETNRQAELMRLLLTSAVRVNQKTSAQVF